MTGGALRTIGATLLQTSNLSRADIELIPLVEFDTIIASSTLGSTSTHCYANEVTLTQGLSDDMI